MRDSVSGVAVEFKAVKKHYGNIKAVDNLDLTIKDGEFFSILGPSGSGKTTCLRLVGGFEQPDAGSLFIAGQDVSGVPPYRRNVNTVFQNYALFPNFNVGENIGYSLKIKKVPAGKRLKKVKELLELVHLPDIYQKKPEQLSGGQKQRVALARALINQPKILLLDEPLGALDLKLRQAMQIELKRIQKQVGITFIYVTHDQAEALSMSDRLGIFHQGRFEQIGAPQEIYEYPKTEFSADFVGTSTKFSGELAKKLSGDTRPFILRPEHLHLRNINGKRESASKKVQTTPKEISLQGAVVQTKNFGGMHIHYQISWNNEQIIQTLVNSQDPHQFAVGDSVKVSWSREHMRYIS